MRIQFGLVAFTPDAHSLNAHGANPPLEVDWKRIRTGSAIKCVGEKRKSHDSGTIDHAVVGSKRREWLLDGPLLRQMRSSLCGEKQSTIVSSSSIIGNAHGRGAT